VAGPEDETFPEVKSRRNGHGEDVTSGNAGGRRSARHEYAVVLAEPGTGAGAAGQARGCFWLGADSPGFVARQVEGLVAGYADAVADRLVADLDGYLRPAGPKLSYPSGIVD
jgi:hypothetical protein